MGYGGAGLIVRAARAACVGVRAMQDASTLREPKHHVARCNVRGRLSLIPGPRWWRAAVSFRREILYARVVSVEVGFLGGGFLGGSLR